jgi:hypothetical protein
VAAAAVIAGLALGVGALSACASSAGDATAQSSATAGPSATAQPDATTSASAGPASSPPPLAPSGGPGPSIKTITVMRSGGLAGLQQTLTITADGSWTFVDKRANVPATTGQLSPDQLRQLTTWVTDPAFAAEAKLPGPAGVCNDGINYTITVGEFTASYERCGNAASRPVTDKILALLADATPM